jgi:hypothetical protein
MAWIEDTEFPDAADVKRIAIGGIQEEGRWHVTLIFIMKDGKWQMRRSEESFDTREEAQAHAVGKVLPKLMATGMFAEDKGDPISDWLQDPQRPQGTVCSAYDQVDGKRVYCGKSADWTLEPNVPMHLCDSHRSEYLKLSPEHAGKFSRIQ